MSFLIDLAERAEQASQGQLAHETALTGALLRYRSTGMATSAVRRKELVAIVEDLEKARMSSATPWVHDALRWAVTSGVADALQAIRQSLPIAEQTTLTDELYERVGARSARDQLKSLANVTKGQGSVVLMNGRQFALHVQGLKDIGREESQAMIEAGVANPARPDFRVADARGAKWQGPKLISTSIRGALLTARNDAFIETLDERGVFVFRVEHLEPTHESNGLIFASRTGTGLDIPLYAEIRGRVFHPNSRALARK